MALTEADVSWTEVTVAVRWRDYAIGNDVYGVVGAGGHITGLCIGIGDEVIFRAVTATTTYMKNSTNSSNDCGVSLNFAGDRHGHRRN